MKLDLDALERRLRSIVHNDVALCWPNPERTALALIARIRELEAEVERGAGLLEARSDAGARRCWAATLRETISKGTVLP